MEIGIVTTNKLAGVSPSSVILLIPAYDPTSRLVDFVSGIRPFWEGSIVVVDDGSAPCVQAEVFSALRKMEGCHVVAHEYNCGKGAALKTGFRASLEKWPETIGFVTADADGQHAPEDVLACADALREDPDKLVLGCRDFDAQDVPFHNRAGNKITRVAMHFFCGVRVSDTQTGLRGIPADFAQSLLGVSGDRFEFETNMLIEMKDSGVTIREIPIQTIYNKEGSPSHFNVVLDSARIYWQFLKYSCSSLVSSVADLALFTALNGVFEGILGIWSITAATITARVASAVLNYLLNKTIVFKSTRRAGASFARYAMLCACVMAVSSALVTAFTTLLGANATLVKVVVDCCLFVVNYQIQKCWVY